jgi:hypothetical protein
MPRGKTQGWTKGFSILQSKEHTQIFKAGKLMEGSFHSEIDVNPHMHTTCTGSPHMQILSPSSPCAYGESLYAYGDQILTYQQSFQKSRVGFWWDASMGCLCVGF